MELSVTEVTVLGLLGEGPSHGFALAKELEADRPIGRILTVRRSLVYRALDRLVEGGLVRSLHAEAGSSGPQRTIHDITRSGRSRLERWLNQPVEHVRDMRIEFLLKLMLMERAGREIGDLVARQLSRLDANFARLKEDLPSDPVELWRHHSAQAAHRFLGDLTLRELSADLQP